MSRRSTFRIEQDVSRGVVVQVTSEGWARMENGCVFDAFVVRSKDRGLVLPLENRGGGGRGGGLGASRVPCATLRPNSNDHKQDWQQRQ